MAGVSHHHLNSCVTGQINGTGLLGVRTDSLPSNFTPVFLSQLLNTSNEDVTSGCHGDPQCKFDALATGNAAIGQNTNMVFEAFQHVNGTLSKSREAPRGLSADRKSAGTPFHDAPSSSAFLFL